MSESQSLTLSSTALGRSVAHYSRSKGRNLLQRNDKFLKWQDARREVGVWPYSRTLHTGPSSVARISDEAGRSFQGINFASQDYLSLASDMRLKDAAIEALDQYGPHSAGSPCLLGNTKISLDLEHALGDTLRLEHVVLFPTGWAAGFGTVMGLLRPDDYVLMDNLAHGCLQRGAYAATQNIIRYEHLNVGELNDRLKEIRETDKENGILVITEGLFSMDSDSPNLAKMQAVCGEYDATLLVDIAHDFGSMGPNGTGELGAQHMLGKVDLVMGSFSKTFGSNGGFLASHSASVRQFVKWNSSTHSLSNAISPVQTAVVLKALEIVRSVEGDALRHRLAENVRHLRAAFATTGITCLGSPSPIVPVPTGSEAVARVASGLIQDRGIIVNLVEFPAVAVGAARFRLQVMTKHTLDNVTFAARQLSIAIEEARDMLRMSSPSNREDRALQM